MPHVAVPSQAAIPEPTRGFGARLRRVGSSLIALMLLAILPPAAITTWLVGVHTDEQIEHASAAVAQDADRLADAGAALLARTQLLLTTLARQPTVRDPAAPVPLCRAELLAAMVDAPWVYAFALVGRNGVVLCGSQGNAPGVSIADRDYFKETIATQGPVLSRMVIGRVAGRAQMMTTLPLFTPGDHAVDRVLLAAVDMQNLARHLRPRDPTDVLMLLDSAGTLVARHVAGQPDHPELLGTSLAHLPVLAAARQADAGWHRGDGAIGQDRLIGFATVPQTGVTVLVLREAAVALAAAHHQRDTAYMLLGLGTLATALAVWWAGRALIGRGMQALTLALAAPEATRAQALARAPIGRLAVFELRRMQDALGSLQTDHDRALATLGTAEQRFRAIHDHAPDCILGFDAAGRVHSANGTAAEIFGCDAHALLGRDVRSLFACLADCRDGAALEAFVADGQETKALAEGGRAVPVSLSIADWKDSSGAVMFTAIARDRSAEVTAEADLWDAVQANMRQADLFVQTTAVMAQGLVAWNAEGRLLLANHQYSTLLDLPDGLVKPGCSYQDIAAFQAVRGDFGPGDPLALAQARFTTISRGDEPDGIAQRANGRWLEYHRRRLVGGGWVTTLTDVTEQREMHDALEESELRFRLLAEHSGDVVALTTMTGVRRYVSPAALRVLGWQPEQLVGRDVREFMHPEDVPDAAGGFAQLAETMGEVRMTYRFRRPDGTWLWVDVHSRRFEHPSMTESCYVTVIRDASERMVIEDKLSDAYTAMRVAAQTDALTGLPNRRMFETELDREWRLAVRAQLPLSVLMIDVDNFKRFNDRYGHAAGDNALRQVAASVRSSGKRPTDTAARWGGEEFIMLLPSTDAEGALVVAEALRAAVQGLEIAHEANPPAGVVTISLGVATIWPERGMDETARTAWISQADAALYAAKATGRNRVVRHVAAPAGDPPPDDAPRHAEAGQVVA